MAKRITNTQLDNLNNLKIIFTHEDPLVRGSGIDYPFKVELKPLTRSESTRLQLDNADENGMIDTIAYQKALFMTQIVGWSGLFENENGENIEATEDFKEKVFEHNFFKTEADLISTKLLQINGIKVKQEEDLKKNLNNSLETEQNTEVSATNV